MATALSPLIDTEPPMLVPSEAVSFACSIQTALVIRRLASQIGVKNVAVVVNKVPEGLALDPIVEALDGLPLLAALPYSPDIMLADVENRCPWTGKPPQVEALDRLVAALEKLPAT